MHPLCVSGILHVDSLCCLGWNTNFVKCVWTTRVYRRSATSDLTRASSWQKVSQTLKMWSFPSLQWFPRQVVSKTQTVFMLFNAWLCKKPKACLLSALTANCIALGCFIFKFFFLVMVCKFAFFLTCYSPLKVLGIWPCQDAVREPPALFSLRPLSLLWARLPPYRGASQRSASKSQEVLRKAPKAKSMDPSLLLPSHTSKTSAQSTSVLFSNWGGLKTSNDGKTRSLVKWTAPC